MVILHFQLRFASSRLSPKTRAVFLLRHGRTLDEIAARLSISRSRVEEYLAEAIQQCSRYVPNRGRESRMNNRIQSEVAEWLLEFETGESSLDARERFIRWRRSKPPYSRRRWLSSDHVRAYVELKNLRAEARRYDSGRTIGVESLHAAARTESSVIPMMKPHSAVSGCAGIPGKGRHVPANSGRPKRAAAKVCGAMITAGFHFLFVGCGFLLLAGSVSRTPVCYATGIGEHRTESFQDGSRVELDGDSEICERFSAGERTVELLKGQALFTVAKASRPFVVASGGTRVRDLATQFDVNQIFSDTVVTVLEGRVAVTNGYSPVAAPAPVRAPSNSVEAGAGEQVLVTPDTISRPRHVNLFTATAWTRNELIFESTPLAQVAVEFNRFSRRQLVIDGTQLQNLPLGGVFPALDPASAHLLHALRALPGIQVIETDDRIIVTKKEGSHL